MQAKAMSDLDEREIAEIIERVRRRVDAAGGERPGAGLRAEAELSAAATAELGDGIHATIDAAVAAATQAFVAFGAQGLASRKVIIDAVRRTMLDHAEQLARMATSRPTSAGSTTRSSRIASSPPRRRGPRISRSRRSPATPG